MAEGRLDIDPRLLYTGGLIVKSRALIALILQANRNRG